MRDQLLAAGGVITAIDAVLDGTVDNVYALTCPPVTTPSPTRGAASASSPTRRSAPHTRARLEASSGLRSSTGTSTTATAPRRSSTTTRPFSRSSSHQDNYYPPDSGHLHEIGVGDGEGYCLNIPLPAGSGVGAYVEAYERVVAGTSRVPAGARDRRLRPRRERDRPAGAHDDALRRLPAPDPNSHGRRGRGLRRQAGPGARGRLLERLRAFLRARGGRGAQASRRGSRTRSWRSSAGSAVRTSSRTRRRRSPPPRPTSLGSHR